MDTPTHPHILDTLEYLVEAPLTSIRVTSSAIFAVDTDGVDITYVFLNEQRQINDRERYEIRKAAVDRGIDVR